MSVECPVCGRDDFTEKRYMRTHRTRVHGDNPNPYQDRETLHRLYVQEGLTTREVADKLDCHEVTVWQWLKRHDIETLDWTAPENERYPELEDEKNLREMYWDEGMSQPQIADEVGCGERTVARWLERHGIETRPAPRDQTPDELLDRGTLEKLYCGARQTSTEIGEQLDVHPHTVTDWLHRHGIPVRELSEYAGEGHWNYKGGRFPYGPGFNKTKKEKVRERDDRECQDCGLSEDEHVERYDEKLHVHHIQKAREVESPEERNAMENLISLCQSCHLGKWEAMSPLRPQSAD